MAMNSTMFRCQIVPMSVADYEEVLQLWRNTEGIGLNESDSRDCIAAYLEHNIGLSCVARHRRKLIGAVLCGHDGRRGYLHHLAVQQEYRHRGIGTRLVETCLARLKKLGIPKCNIFIFESNDSGEAFWNHLGWAKRDDLRVMQKALNRVSTG